MKLFQAVKFVMRCLREKKKLYNHMRVHQEEPCKFCFKKIPKNAMRAHLAVCENNEEKKSFSCDQCRICNLKSHTESVHKEEKEPKENKVTIETKRKLTSEKHECGVCGKMFSHQFTLTRHLNTIHLKKKIESSAMFGFFEES